MRTPDAACQFLDAAKPRLLSAEKDGVISAVGRTKIGKLIDIVLHSGLAKYGGRNHADTRITDGEPVSLRGPVKMIGSHSPTLAGHVFHDDGGIPRKIFLQKRH